MATRRPVSVVRPSHSLESHQRSVSAGSFLPLKENKEAIMSYVENESTFMGDVRRSSLSNCTALPGQSNVVVDAGFTSTFHSDSSPNNANALTLPVASHKSLEGVGNTDRGDVSWFVVKITVIASIGGILFGYDLGVISGALPQLSDTFALNTSQQEVVVSILYLGGGLGATVGGSLCDSIGRKKTIILTDIIFTVGAFVLFAAPSYLWVVVGRIVVGFGVAVSGIADVSYLHEIAPVHVRGAIVSVNEACISLGFLLAFVSGRLLAKHDEGWRTMFGISGIFAIIQLIGMWRLPESPKWLQQQGRFNESDQALMQINPEYTERSSPTGASDGWLWSKKSRREDHVPVSPQKYQSMNSTSELETTIIPPSREGPFETVTSHLDSSHPFRKQSYCQTIMLAFHQGLSFLKVTFVTYRRQCYITLFLAITQQFCGQTNVLSYAPLIFAGVAKANTAIDEDVSASEFVTGWTTLSIGLVKFMVTVLVIWRIEKVGRRVLLLFGMATIAVGLLFLSAAFAGSPSQGSFFSSQVLALPGVWLVVTGYSMSFGPLTWLLTSELFPTDIRGRALGISTIVTYVCAILVTSTFLSSQEIFGSSAVFAFYAIFTLFGFSFAYYAISDTGERNPEEIDEDLRNMPFWLQNHRASDGMFEIPSSNEPGVT